MKKLLPLSLSLLSITLLAGCDLTGKTEQENITLKQQISGLQEQISGLNSQIIETGNNFTGAGNEISPDGLGITFKYLGEKPSDIQFESGPYQGPNGSPDQSITKEEKDTFLNNGTCPWEGICKKRVVGDLTILYGIGLSVGYEGYPGKFQEYIHIFLPKTQIYLTNDNTFQSIMDPLFKEYTTLQDNELKKREGCPDPYSEEGGKNQECINMFVQFRETLENFTKQKINDNGPVIQKAMQYTEAIVNSIRLK